MSAFIAFLAILFICGIGYVIIWAFRLLPSGNPLLSLSYSYGLGVGFVSFQLYMYSRLHIPWHKELLLIPDIILIFFLLLMNKKRITIHIPKRPKVKRFEVLLLIGILATCCYVVFEALIRPVTVWDAWAIWLFKSKIFYIDGQILHSAFQYEPTRYPLIINLLGTFIYLMIGRIDDTAVLLTSSAFYISLALLFYCSLRNRFSFRYALLFTFLLITTQNFVRQGGRMEAGQADLPLGYYAFACFLLLLMYLKNSNKKNFFMLNIFIGILSLIKNEGIPLGIMVQFFALLHIYRQKLYTHLVFLLGWLIPFIDWQIYLKTFGSENSYFTQHAFMVSFPKIIDAFVGTVKELVTIKSWNLLWIMYFLSLVLIKYKINKELFIANSIILLQLSIYIFLYMFTRGNEPASSIERLLIHIAPLALYMVAFSLATLHYLPSSILQKKGK